MGEREGGRERKRQRETGGGVSTSSYFLKTAIHGTVPFSVNQTVMPSYWIYSGKEEQRRKRHETQ